MNTFDPNKVLTEYGITQFDDLSFKLMLAEFDGFVEMVEKTVTFVRENNFEASLCQDCYADFYIEGWEEKYSGENGFYDLSRNFDEILLVVNSLKDTYDMQPVRDHLKAQLSVLWSALPDFYKMHEVISKKPAQLPVGYELNQPFPSIAI